MTFQEYSFFFFWIYMYALKNTSTGAITLESLEESFEYRWPS